MQLNQNGRLKTRIFVPATVFDSHTLSLCTMETPQSSVERGIGCNWSTHATYSLICQDALNVQVAHWEEMHMGYSRPACCGGATSFLQSCSKAGTALMVRTLCSMGALCAKTKSYSNLTSAQIRECCVCLCLFNIPCLQLAAITVNGL
jgi:hypothetical protein